MIHHYRISKYDPKLRDKNGHYKDLDDWTGFNYVGEKVRGKVLTLKSYLETEESYIFFLERYLFDNKIKSMTISEIENISFPNNNLGLKKNEKLNSKLIIEIARFCLRGDIWCKLSKGKRYIHFGYDFYVFLGSGKKMLDEKRKYQKFKKIYLERFMSPYLQPKIR